MAPCSAKLCLGHTTGGDPHLFPQLPGRCYCWDIPGLEPSSQDDQAQTLWVFIRANPFRALCPHRVWHAGGHSGDKGVTKTWYLPSRASGPLPPLRPDLMERHTLALFSLMNSGPKLPAPGTAGSPTSVCHWPKAPKALFTRHFLTEERRKQ